MAMPPVNWLEPDLRVDLGSPAGAFNSMLPQIAVDGDGVYIVWYDNRNGGEEDIYFNRSLNRGADWMTPDIRLDTSAGIGESLYPKISVSGDHVYVIWQDDRNADINDIYFNRSLNRGTTWMAQDVRLDTGGTGTSRDPRICSAGSHVYAVWLEELNGDRHIWFSRSADHGNQWSSPVNLNLIMVQRQENCEDPEICCDGANVFVTWSENRMGAFDIYFSRSINYGVDWSSPLRLDTGDTAGSHHSRFPQICLSGGNVYVIWSDGRTNPDGIFINRSNNSGADWLASDVRVDVDDVGDSRNPRICCSGTNVYVTWYEQDDPMLQNYEVFFNRSVDGGLSWLPADTRLDTGDTPWHWRSLNPRICCSGNNIHVAYGDDRNGGFDIYFNHSGDGGVSWMGTDFRLDTGSSPGSSTSGNVEIACTADNVFAAWRDSRDGGNDIYFNTTQSPPRANAGTDGEGLVGETYSLDGSRSYDPDSDRLTYRWSLTACPAGASAEIDGSGQVSPDFVPDVPGEYRFRLTVTDPFGASSNDQVTVTVINPIELTLTAGPGGTVIPAPGIYLYDRGENVTLEAVPDSGYIFSGWSGDVTGTANPLSILMETDKSVHANFVRMVYSPVNFSGIRLENRSLSMREYVARLAWQSHPDNYNITGYRISRVTDGVEITLATRDADTFVFEELGVPRDGSLVYRIYALRADGFESDPAVATVN